jgi:D-glycero-beta-D-manno-heptose-7-phosphate kinase
LIAVHATIKEVTELFEGFNNLKVMVVGDVMIDAYYWGKVDRISPEAPVPVVQITNRENRLGGAANVALNLHALGAKPFICSVIGDDEKGQLFQDLMDELLFSNSGLIRSTTRLTTVKTRIISGAHHLLRVDEETTTPLTSEEEERIIGNCVRLMDDEKIDVVVFEDYNKGVVTQRVITAVIAEAKKRSIPTSVDPKKDNFLAFKGVDLFKPNLKELQEGVKQEINKKDFATIIHAVGVMEEALQNRISLVTMSEMGVYVKEGENNKHILAHPREILDVSGAGDTVISVAALLLAQKASPELIALVSNLAGGLVCEKVGVVPIDKQQLLNEALKYALA